MFIMKEILGEERQIYINFDDITFETYAEEIDFLKYMTEMVENDIYDLLGRNSKLVRELEDLKNNKQGG